MVIKDGDFREFISALPKAELHLHIEGTFEPEMAFEMSKRNGIKLKYNTAEELRLAYSFSNLQDFLDIYYQNASVLIKERDFYDLAFAYLKKARSQNVLHAEIFFDPQTHTDRGIKFETVIKGLSRACMDGKNKLGISSKLIMCFLRHLDEGLALKTLEEAIPYKDLITAVGLDSSEVGFPPSKFAGVFEKARQEGFLTVAHAGEEGPAGYIREAIDLLKVSRIDHGNHILDDKELISEVTEKKIPLTICPLSNLKLKVVKDMKDHPLKKMLDLGLKVTINSDDPAYFGGYVNENYLVISEALNLSKAELTRLARNSFDASFISSEEKAEFLKELF